MDGHILVVPVKLGKVHGPSRFGPKKSKRSWCNHKFSGHLFDAERFYAALQIPDTDISETAYYYEPYWDYACEECAARLGWIPSPNQEGSSTSSNTHPSTPGQPNASGQNTPAQSKIVQGEGSKEGL